MKCLFKRNNGIGLIEILITLSVLAVGILGVAGLNSVISKQSQENKAQAEALAIAQSRIEEVRNYTNDVDTLAAFDLQYADTQGYVDAPSEEGTNAIFTRSERITDSGNNKIFDVVVTWTGSDGIDQTVTLNTELAYISPRSKGDFALTAAPEIVDAPTGRARLGEGTLSPDAEQLGNPNGDGTAEYMDGTDRKLAVGNQVVLTLALACQTDSGTCIDFVKIKGRIYLDSSTGRQPHEISLVASDAAYCARYYTIGTTKYPFVKNVTSKTQTPQTANNNYEYFDYTCYLGGGWHGNVGVIFSGGITQRDKVCVGDFVTTPETRYTKPTVAVRRAYRGLIYKPSELVTVNNVVQQPWKYYTQGIADGMQFPVGNGHGHDFVVGEMQPNENAGSDCIKANSLMTRTDSKVSNVTGALFQGMPNGFVCFNKYSGYLDPYTNVYDSEPDCAFDPTNPPSVRYILSGDVILTAPLSTTNEALSEAINVVTSDGEGNCLVTDEATYNGTGYVTTYFCDVYDWPNDITNGWNGYVKPVYSTGVRCTPGQLPFTNVNADDDSGNNLACAVGQSATWTGTVTQLGSAPHTNKTLTTVTMTGTDSSGATVNGTCGIAGDRLSYTCTITPLFGTWTGNMNFTSGAKITDGGAMCQVSATTTKIYPVGPVGAGPYTQNLTIGCDPGVTATWTGTVTQGASNPKTVKKISEVTLIGTDGVSGTCLPIPNNGLSYSCTTPQFLGIWSGQLKITSAGGAICETPVGTTATYDATGGSGPHTRNLKIGKADGSECP